MSEDKPFTLEALLDFTWTMESTDIDEERISKFILQEEDGGIIVAVTPFGNGAQKDMLIEALAKMIVTEKKTIVRYVMVSEAWASRQRRGDGPEPIVMPSEDPERREILLAIGVERGRSTLMRQAEIITDRDGTRSLGEVENAENSIGGGRMASLFEKIDAARMSLN